MEQGLTASDGSDGQHACNRHTYHAQHEIALADSLYR